MGLVKSTSGDCEDERVGWRCRAGSVRGWSSGSEGSLPSPTADQPGGAAQLTSPEYPWGDAWLLALWCDWMRNVGRGTHLGASAALLVGFPPACPYHSPSWRQAPRASPSIISRMGYVLDCGLLPSICPPYLRSLHHFWLTKNAPSCFPRDICIL